ncbi:cytochrome P450 [Aspergillus karnatakaensis]|uniref:cytochrome P450 n=1 Tax=Aspergillus karnatakaensis TaxID=1810916 RepID=UPI003CCD376B
MANLIMAVPLVTIRDNGKYSFAVLSLGAVVVFILLRSLYRAHFHPLRKIPGPRLAQITELWRTWQYFKGGWFYDVAALHRVYGPVVRIAPNEVSVVSSDLIKTIFSHSGGTPKTAWYDTWLGLTGDATRTDAPRSTFTVTDVKHHSFLRRRVSAAYSMSTIVSMEPLIQTILDSLWNQFEQLASTNTPVNLSLWASFFTYDIVGKLSLGEPLGFIAAGHDKNSLIPTIHKITSWAANMGALPGRSAWYANPLITWLGPKIGIQITDFAKLFAGFSVDQIPQRMQECREEGGDPGKTKQRDMLDYFVGMKDEKGGPASIRDISIEVGSLVAAGADTTSVAIKAVLCPILEDPLRYQRLQREIDDAHERSGLNNASAGNLSFSNLKELPFLDACIKEGLRLHPSIVYQLPRKAPEGGITIEGYYIHPSATVSMSPVAQNRCRSIFGEDADEYRPERWIEGEGSSGEQIKEMNKQLATFGYGSRTCIGRNLAMFELFKFVAQLLSRYQVELCTGKKEWAVHAMWFAEIHNQGDKGSFF